MDRFQESRGLLTAVELGIFTAVGPGAAAAQVSETLGTHPRATETPLNALVAVGALTKKDGRFFNTPDTAPYLVAESPENTRPALMHTVDMFTSWATLTDCVRAGTAVRSPGGEQPERGWKESCVAAMHRGAVRNRAAGVSGVRRLLDIGGGSGAYSTCWSGPGAVPHMRKLSTNPGSRARDLRVLPRLIHPAI